MRVLLLRLEAPLMAFGAPVVDQHNVVARFPALSMIVGLFANALGWDHRDGAHLDALQARLLIASRIDRDGVPLIDFQTAQLGRDDRGWTTRGRPEGRAGGAATYDSPHIRYRHHIADAVCTVAATLDPVEGAPDLAALATALDEPARPLFIGRKACLPDGRLLVGAVEAASLIDALRQGRPAWDGPRRREDDTGPRPAQWPEGGSSGAEPSERRGVFDRRDWVNQIHTGRRWVREGVLAPRGGPS